MFSLINILNCLLSLVLSSTTYEISYIDQQFFIMTLYNMCVMYCGGVQYHGGDQYRGGYYEYCGGYVEYHGGVQYRGGIMINVGIS